MVWKERRWTNEAHMANSPAMSSLPKIECVHRSKEYGGGSWEGTASQMRQWRASAVTRERI